MQSSSVLVKLGGVALPSAPREVAGGHPTLVFDRLKGINDKVYPEEAHIIIPWFERPIIYDVRARPNLEESTSVSRDLQMGDEEG